MVWERLEFIDKVWGDSIGWDTEIGTCRFMLHIELTGKTREDMPEAALRAVLPQAARDCSVGVNLGYLWAPLHSACQGPDAGVEYSPYMRMGNARDALTAAGFDMVLGSRLTKVSMDASPRQAHPQIRSNAVECRQSYVARY